MGFYKIFNLEENRTVTVLDQETKIVDVVVVIKFGPSGWEGVRGDWKVRVKAVDFKQGTRVYGDSPP
jgi:hypothetical protein